MKSLYVFFHFLPLKYLVQGLMIFLCSIIIIFRHPFVDLIQKYSYSNDVEYIHFQIFSGTNFIKSSKFNIFSADNSDSPCPEPLNTKKSK